jgi:cell division protein FtsA
VGDIVVGIDIGTSKVCTSVGRINKENQVEILGQGFVPCTGVRKGIIVDIESTASAVRNSVEAAEKNSNLKISSAFINILGTHVSIISNRSCTSVSNDNREITKKDVDRVLYAVRDVPVPEDRQLIDIIPRQFIIDGYDEIVDPVGMVGVKLEVEADVVTGKITSVQNIIKSLEKANVKVDGLVAEAYATGEVLLTPEEKEMGVILIDIGGGVTDLSVFKNRRLVFYDSIPVGGDHITNDLSIGLRISSSEAEKVKRQFELALTSLIKNDQEVSVYDVNEDRKKEIKVSEIVEIIEARVFEIFSLCHDLLVKNNIGFGLGGGVVLAGGGISYVDGCKQLANDVFELPVRIGAYKAAGVHKPEFAASIGMIRYISSLHKGSNVVVNVKAQKLKDVDSQNGFLKKIAKFISDLF